MIKRVLARKWWMYKKVFTWRMMKKRVLARERVTGPRVEDDR